MTFSIIMPCEENRLDLLGKTLDKYNELGIPENTEFIIPSRTIMAYPKCRVIYYEHKGKDFNPSRALNLGVQFAKNDYIIITSPEVMPITDVLDQLWEERGNNVICQVFDQNAEGKISYSLVNSKFRSGTPCMYFLALFNKKDVEAINGWDENFMTGYAWEDDDFGRRFVRAGLAFKVRDDIQAIHQFHPREVMGNGWNNNRALLDKNDAERVIKPKNGLRKL